LYAAFIAWGVKHRTPWAKQADSGGGVVPLDINCQLATAGTNTACPVPPGAMSACMKLAL